MLFPIQFDWDKVRWKQVANTDDFIMQLQTYFYPHSKFYREWLICVFDASSWKRTKFCGVNFSLEFFTHRWFPCGNTFCWIIMLILWHHVYTFYTSENSMYIIIIVCKVTSISSLQNTLDLFQTWECNKYNKKVGCSLGTMSFQGFFIFFRDFN